MIIGFLSSPLCWCCWLQPTCSHGKFLLFKAMEARCTSASQLIGFLGWTALKSLISVCDHLVSLPSEPLISSGTWTNCCSIPATLLVEWNPQLLLPWLPQAWGNLESQRIEPILQFSMTKPVVSAMSVFLPWAVTMFWSWSIGFLTIIKQFSMSAAVT